MSLSKSTPSDQWQIFSASAFTKELLKNHDFSFFENDNNKMKLCRFYTSTASKVLEGEKKEETHSVFWRPQWNKKKRKTEIQGHFDNVSVGEKNFAV